PRVGLTGLTALGLSWAEATFGRSSPNPNLILRIWSYHTFPAAADAAPSSAFAVRESGKREMAAMRSALAMLSRRSCGSSSAVSMGGRGMEVNQVYRSMARTPPLRSAAVRNPESSRCMTTGGGDPSAEVKSVLRLWWERARDRVKNADEEEKNRAFYVYGLIVASTPSWYVIRSAIDLYETMGMPAFYGSWPSDVIILLHP
ncbi:hypothetical protein EJB05_40831, partial [Eragrostis curvula]